MEGNKPLCRDNGWKCHNQREPLEHFSHPHVPEPLVVSVLAWTRFPVFVYITSMSASGRDGHISAADRVYESACVPGYLKRRDL
ncbi:hypothetical protein Leryth_014604 [Lithospermum erythrorhizon]|nr:hypothetical protein Leryth_014604 [Lithospermum erythrorhizon]